LQLFEHVACVPAAASKSAPHSEHVRPTISVDPRVADWLQSLEQNRAVLRRLGVNAAPQ
jgi:hypothetical protein